MRRIKTAQNEATTPTRAIELSPSKGFLKSIKVMLKIRRETAKSTNMLVKIFIDCFFAFLRVIFYSINQCHQKW
jgi:hypothetical protein